MEMKKLISLMSALAVSAGALGGFVFSASADDTETVYNFSTLTDESYSIKDKTVNVFGDAITLTAAEDAVPVAVSRSAASPLGNTLEFKSALKAKKLSVSMHLDVGETMVVYYGGTDLAGTAVKALSMNIMDAAGTSVATEDYSENKELKPYAIAYTADTEGTYTACDTVGSNRTFVYAAVKTTAAYNPDITPQPVVTPTPDPDATATPTPTNSPSPTPKATIDPDAKQEVKLVKSQGWLESAYITWTNSSPVEKYNVYIKKDGEEYTKIDDELIRYYGGYYRADAVGLQAGSYRMKVAPVVGGAEGEAAESDVMEVKSYIREGFAFDSTSSYYNADGIDAYKNDGTLKDGAKVVYITDSNKDTVKFDVVTDKNKGTVTECTGLAEILTAREKNNAETTPLAIRLIGKVTTPNGVNSANYIQIKATSNVTMEGIGDDSGTYHWSLLLRDTSNVEVRNIAVMEFYDDGISLDTNNYNDWVHNCDIFYGQNRGGDQKKGDGSLDVKSGSDYCSFSYNHFWDSGKTSLCGMKVDSYKGYHVTYYGNWFDHSDSRHPRVRGDQVHVYNNYYDGVSKYGVGACTGSSVFVENNVFRNALHPVLTSRQGTDALGDGTFSGEDGGSIKMYNNAIYGGIGIIDGKANNTNNADAYVVDSRDEKVPDTYTAIQGGGSYSNFDTADNMYQYSVIPTEQVVDTVTKYAGRVENGDFNHDFDDEVDDTDYERNSVLGGELEKYTSAIVSEYVTGTDYPKTEGASESSPKPTNAPFDPDVQPTSRPSGSDTPSAEGKTMMWRASDNGKAMSAGDVLYIQPEDTEGVPNEGAWLSLIGAGVEYTETNKSINGVAFTGKMNAPSGQTAPTLGENGTNGAALKALTKDNGTISVYIKLNAGKTFYITDLEGNAAAEYTNNTGSSEYTRISAELEGGKEYHIFGDGTNIEFWGVSFTVEGSDTPSATDVPSATDTPSATDAPSATDTPSATDAPSATTEPDKKYDCVKITAEYDEMNRLISIKSEPARSEDAVNTIEKTRRVIYWKSLNSMEPVK